MAKKKGVLIGQRYGRLTVVKRIGKDRNGHLVWGCNCDCGQTTNVTTQHLKNGHVKSCGCYKKEMLSKTKIKDLTGQRFGMLTVMEDSGERTKTQQVKWKCMCDCGNVVNIQTGSLQSKRTISCGCYQSGKNHPMYNPNITDGEREKGRYILGKVAINTWRKEVYERDNYTCCYCGQKSTGNLHAHHINGYNWCKSQRFDVDNGITLCADCHKKFHRDYGKGNNSKAQFEMFMKGGGSNG